MPITLPGDLVRLSTAIGPADTSLYALSRLLWKISFGRVRLIKYYLMSQPVPPGELTPARRGRAILVSEGHPLEALQVPFGRPEEVIQRRLAFGCRFLLARKGTELVGFQWFTLEDYPEDEVRCLFRLRPGSHCAWDFDVFVKPEARSQPVFTRLWDACNAILRDEDVRRTLSRIDAFNQRSRQAHRRLGAAPVGWCAFLVAGRLQLSLFSGRPWIHLSTTTARVPELVVSDLGRSRGESAPDSQK